MSAGTKTLVEGFDCSTNHALKWEELTSLKRCHFAFLQAAHGTTVPAAFVEAFSSRDKTLPTGIYQRLISNWSGGDHANVLINTFKSNGMSLGECDLPPVLDLERDPQVANFTWTSSEYMEAIDGWVTEVAAFFGRKPILYMNEEFANFASVPNRFTEYPLWFAHYVPAAPPAPKPWAAYTFWQSAQNQTVDGVNLQLDLNSFFGDDVALKQFVARSKI
jgi:lysozyme